MTATSSAFPFEKSNAYRAILCGGLIAGILDITYAFVMLGMRGRSPIWTLQSIASGLLGPDAFKGGLWTAALGSVLHFLIAAVATAIYYGASRKLVFLVRHAIVWGLLYGVVVYLFMNFIVLPLAFRSRVSPQFAAIVSGLIGHMLLVGLPISLAVRRYSK